MPLLKRLKNSGSALNTLARLFLVPSPQCTSETCRSPFQSGHKDEYRFKRYLDETPGLCTILH